MFHSDQDSGYVLLYRHDTITDRIVILAIKHQREAGYSPQGQ